jgi:hypothetical protein
MNFRQGEIISAPACHVLLHSSKRALSLVQVLGKRHMCRSWQPSHAAHQIHIGEVGQRVIKAGDVGIVGGVRG